LGLSLISERICGLGGGRLGGDRKISVGGSENEMIHRKFFKVLSLRISCLAILIATIRPLCIRI
jgi:hypothetical protein